MDYHPHHQPIQHTSPEQYLRKFKTPKSTISFLPSKDPQKDCDVLDSILNKSYNDRDPKRKAEILEDLKGIVKSWMITAAGTSELPRRCGLEIFGSYQLGASSFDSDIDAVCIVPDEVTRDKHFFVDLVAIFSKHPNVQEVFPIPMALVPLIKIKFYSIQFDILMSQIDKDRLELPSDRFFGGGELDIIPERELKSINGCRVACYLKQSLKNYEYFTMALKAIKMWAKNRGVYSQIFCYLGGISYTILLAKICQLYPNYSPLKLLDRFFFIYSHWEWEIPVTLESLPVSDIDTKQRAEMTIMTPVSPSMNAAHSVSKSTLRIMRQEFREASRTIDEISNGKKTWPELFRPVRFFEKSKYFLELVVLAKYARDFTSWKGNIESKFRKLIKLLENVENSLIIEINPNPRQFTSKHHNYAFCSKYYFGIRCRRGNNDDDLKEVDFSQAVRGFLQFNESYAEIQKSPDLINIAIACLRKDKVPIEIRNSDIYYTYQ